MALFDALTFCAFPPKQRGSAARTSAAVAFTPGPLLRTSVPVVDVLYDDELTLIHKTDDALIAAEERPPAFPYEYSWQVCSLNTFTCSDSSISPQEIRGQVKDIIEKSPADVSACSEWQFHAVFYPQEQRTAFEVSIFEGPKNSCLVEMRLQDGDRAAFQGLASHVRLQAKLKYAFAEQWGFQELEEGTCGPKKTKCDTSYKHTCFTPLPLPSSLLASLGKPDITTDDSENPLANILLENACSPFVDVRQPGWQELANLANKIAFAKSLLHARANGQSCVTLAAAELKADVTCGITIEIKRCVLKTLLNIAKTKDVETCRKICVLKPQILQLANDSKNNPTETRATAVQLMQNLVGYRKEDDKDFVQELQKRCVGTCRVSELARKALSSLDSVFSEQCGEL